MHVIVNADMIADQSALRETVELGFDFPAQFPSRPWREEENYASPCQIMHQLAVIGNPGQAMVAAGYFGPSDSDMQAYP